MATDPESLAKEEGPAGDRVRSAFSQIAPRYDLLNHLLSLNVDRGWRRRAVDALDVGSSPVTSRILDTCAGTFDMSLELATRPEFSGTVIALDFAFPMLAAGRGKLADTAVRAVCGDSLRLPFPERSFDSVMVAFGIRNLEDRDLGLRELHRVLKPGGVLVVLEFSTPPNPLFRPFYLFYFRRLLPLIGRIVSGHSWAYSYLPASVQSFPDPDSLAGRIRGAGFEEVEWFYLTAGIAAIHRARAG